MPNPMKIKPFRYDTQCERQIKFIRKSNGFRTDSDAIRWALREAAKLLLTSQRKDTTT